jgi:hypothetical protein
MSSEAKSKGKKLLLMGSSAFKAKELPAEVKEKIEEAIASDMMIIVGEAFGACRLFQDYLALKDYRNVIVGHAVRLRYNAGNWKDFQYGKDLKERERRMIEDCDSAIIMWMNNSGVIAENLELLKRLGKPTFLYEYSSKINTANAGELDPKRNYDPYYFMKEQYRKLKYKQSQLQT